MKRAGEDIFVEGVKVATIVAPSGTTEYCKFVDFIDSYDDFDELDVSNYGYEFSDE